MANNYTTTVSSKTKSVLINRDKPTVIIGERINPTGRKKVLAALQEGNFDIVREDASSQVAAGAKILDVNAGVPGADEPALIQQVMRTVIEVTDVPLCIDTADPEALAAALKLYEGKALVNSVNGEERSLEAVLPLVKDHGAAVIGLVKELVLERLVGKGGNADDAYFDEDQFTFGTSLRRSDLEAVIQDVPGVKAVRNIQIRRRGYFNWRDMSEPYYPIGDGEILRLENDRNHPERGILTLHMEGGA